MNVRGLRGLLPVAVLLGLGVGCSGGPVEEPPTAPAALAAPAAEAPRPEREGPTDEQIAALTAAVEQNPTDAAAHRQLAVALHLSRRSDKAVRHFEQAADLDPSPRRLLDLALSYSSVARLTDAEATYGKLLEASPNHPIALHNLGNVYTKQGRMQPAIEHYMRAIEAKPDYLLAIYHLGDALKRIERYREAYQTYERVLDIDPTTPEDLVAFDDALYQMAALDIRMGAHERAGQMLEELLRANPSHPAAHYAYGQVLLKLGRLDEAQRELELHMAILAETEPEGPVATGR